MQTLKITLLQQPLSWMNGAANLRHFDRLLENLSGRDVIVLPEMFTTGFAMEAAQASLPQQEVVALAAASRAGHPGADRRQRGHSDRSGCGKPVFAGGARRHAASV